jgi:hypothetical protein
MTSAKIYQFPAGGRSGHGGRREETQPVVIKSTAAFAVPGQASSNFASANRVATRVANTVLGSAWYHDAAIQDAEPARNN